MKLSLPDNASDGKVVEKTAPWSYVVETPTGKFQTNRQHIVTDAGSYW